MRRNMAKLELFCKFTNSIAMFVILSINWISFALYFNAADPLSELWQIAWISQDIHGIALITIVVQSVHVPNLKVGILLCAFLFEIFWVFVSKKLFHESVMIVVARGDKCGEDGFLVLLKTLRMFDTWGGCNIIGYGDIFLPGLLIAFSLGYDWLANKTLRARYFLWVRLAYGLDLLITYVALDLMDGHGQLALLYIVPFILRTFLSLGKREVISKSCGVEDNVKTLPTCPTPTLKNPMNKNETHSKKHICNLWAKCFEGRGFVTVQLTRLCLAYTNSRAQVPLHGYSMGSIL
ncbi:signal peptide peptidase-like 2 [Juglans microcarpa x Juglans regia]|uniref:signal peptide peptidase-like 2 n=1 Tax=Juglans microcarpa x Juglans regia TaxID=2249226 RepID=UPI001B7E3DF8|nr:signal peptide peptidase-like 2 [Juglans microcarpa x Juglans regia]